MEEDDSQSNVSNKRQRVGRIIEVIRTEDEEETLKKRAIRKEKKNKQKGYINKIKNEKLRAEEWILDLFSTSEDSKIDLYEDNLKLKSRDDPLTHLNDSILGQIPDWLQLSDEEDFTVEGRMKFEAKLVYEMNSWLGVLSLNDKEQQVVVKKRGDDGLFTFLLKSINSTRQMFESHKVATFDKELLFTYTHVIKTHKNELSSVRKKADGTFLLPQIIIIQQTLFDIWYNHKGRKTYKQIVFNPRPSFFAKAAHSLDLNKWPGFAYNRDDVLQYTDWSNIVPLLNHFRYTWADNEGEYKHLLGLFALMLQQPYTKSGVAICVGGDEGTGKSLPFVDVLGKIMGSNLFAHLQNMSDVTGEFTSTMTDKLLVLVDECLFAGNNKDANILKKFITGDTDRIREMYHNPVYKESFKKLCLQFKQ